MNDAEKEAVDEDEDFHQYVIPHSHYIKTFL